LWLNHAPAQHGGDEPAGRPMPARTWVATTLGVNVSVPRHARAGRGARRVGGGGPTGGSTATRRQPARRAQNGSQQRM